MSSDQDRVGDYVRRALPCEMERRGCSWETRVEWDDVAIRGYLYRGELVLSAVERALNWWLPATQAKGDRLTEGLANVLEKFWHQYEDADDTGRRRAQVDRGDRGVVDVILEPGVRLETQGGTSVGLVFRHQEPPLPGASWDDAVGLGWVKPLY